MRTAEKSPEFQSHDLSSVRRPRWLVSRIIHWVTAALTSGDSSSYFYHNYQHPILPSQHCFECVGDDRRQDKILDWRTPRVTSPRNFTRARVCISPAPQPRSPKLETTRSLTKSRLRTQKSNILLALLAPTDIIVGIAIQPGFIAVLEMPLFDEKCGCHVFRAFRFATGTVIKSSLFHLVLISGERYIAIKHLFAYTTMVTEARLLVASALAWLLSVILQIPTFVDKALFFPIKNTFVGLSIAFIVVCHVTIYRETRRHERQGHNFKKIKRL